MQEVSCASTSNIRHRVSTVESVEGDNSGSSANDLLLPSKLLSLSISLLVAAFFQAIRCLKGAFASSERIFSSSNQAPSQQMNDYWYLSLQFLFPFYILLLLVEIQQNLMILFPFASLVYGFEATASTLYVFLYIVNVAGLFFSGALLYIHGTILFNGIVSYEKKHKIKDYDFGMGQNVKELLGEKWYLVWFYPFVQSKLPRSGISWEALKRDEKESNKDNVSGKNLVCRVSHDSSEPSSDVFNPNEGTLSADYHPIRPVLFPDPLFTAGKAATDGN
ncbi:hypothetical protein J437_LFUL000543 [Ladona fulva]|uniref:Uncharacterized protein n=1 Tax=Ladona fulva TaxID=123851 RepID=A0A8K0JWE1_LADFU|nr:hypothetical protein J437_LFUL000543 [Ladona fulva]